MILLVFLTAGNLAGLHFARWSTSMGPFTAELYDQWVPITANNFISLANSGFYNDLIFHRVVAGFVIQDGCPQGTGYGGPGYTIQDEFYPGFHHDQAGILAMARTSAPNSAGSQYYITLAPTPHLDGGYAIFGKVVQGLEVVMAIGSVPVDANDRPLTPVNIDTLRILDLAIGNVTPPDSVAVALNVGAAQMVIVEAEALNSPLAFHWYVDGVLQGDWEDFLFETAFSAVGNHEVRCDVSSQDWAHEVTWAVEVANVGAEDLLVPAPSPLLISPNPSHGGFSVKLADPADKLDRVSVFDLKGRLLRQAEAENEWQWDGQNADGRPVPAGIYIIRAYTLKGSVWRKCAKL